MLKRKNHKSKMSIIDFQQKFNTEDKYREFLLIFVSRKALYVLNAVAPSITI